MSGIFQNLPQWLADFQNGLLISYDDAWSMTNTGLIWDQLATQRSSSSLYEDEIWIPDTVSLVDTGLGGQHVYSAQTAFTDRIKNTHAGNMLRLTRDEIDDQGVMVDGKRVALLDYAGSWARGVGTAAAYRPQKLVMSVIFFGETVIKAFDGELLFAVNRPINYKDPSAGTYSNLFTGAASGIYPGAIPIYGLTPAQAAANIAKGVAYIESLTGTHGEPLRLKVEKLFGGPELRKIFGDALDTKFIGNDGSTENTLAKYGVTYETAAELTDPDYLGTYYFKVTAPQSDRGPVIYQLRQAHSITMYSPEQELDLGRKQQFEWLADGRDGVAAGDPRKLFKAKGA